MADEAVAVLDSYLRCVECSSFFNSDKRRPRMLRCRHGICDPCARDALRGGSVVTCRNCGCRTEVHGVGADAIEKNNVVEGIVQFFTPSGKAYTDEEASAVLPRMLAEARIAVETGRLLGRPSGDTYPPVGEQRGRARPNGPEEGQYPSSSAAFSLGIGILGGTQGVSAGGGDGDGGRPAGWNGPVVGDVHFSESSPRHQGEILSRKEERHFPPLAATVNSQQQARIPRTWAAEPAVNRAPAPDRGMTAGNRRRSPLPPPETASARSVDCDSTGDGDHEVPPLGPRNRRRRNSSDEDSDGGRGSVVSRPTRRTTSWETKSESKGEKSYLPRPRQQREAASKKGWGRRRDEDEDEHGRRSDFDSDSEDDSSSSSSSDGESASDRRDENGEQRPRRRRAPVAKNKSTDSTSEKQWQREKEKQTTKHLQEDAGDGNPGASARGRLSEPPPPPRSVTPSPPPPPQFPVDPRLSHFAFVKPQLTDQERDFRCAVCTRKLTEKSPEKMRDSVANASTIVVLPCCHLHHHHCVVKALSKYNKSELYFECPRTGCKRPHLRVPKVGSQPEGVKMIVDLESIKESGPLPGFQQSRTIRITYKFEQSRQSAHHPSPGKMFEVLDFPRKALLPYTAQGYKVLCMLRIAFQRRLIFKVGDSAANRRPNCLVWSGVIPHKTSRSGGGEYGYPDGNYLDNVTKALEKVGITPADIPKNPKSSLGLGFDAPGGK